MTFGVTPQGFNRKQLQDILDDLTTAQRARFGALFDTSAPTAQGQMNGTFASGLAECWELVELAYHAFDRDATSGDALTFLAALIGVERRAAKASTVLLSLTLNAGATVPAGSIIQHSTRPDIRFTLDATLTNGSGITKTFTNQPATCTQTGPTIAIAGSLTVIITPATGWTVVNNPADAIAGRDVDSDVILRQRMQDAQALRGGSTVAAIKADLLDTENHPELLGINSATVLENVTDHVDANGLPPHSFEAVIDDFAQDGVTHQINTPASIAQSIWNTKPGGIPAGGTTSATATDDNGSPQVVKFSYVSPKPVYIAITPTRGSGYPSDGDDQIKAALVKLGATLLAGQSVIALAFRAAAMSIAGVTDVPAYAQGFSPGPVSSANLALGVRERATFSSLNITVS